MSHTDYDGYDEWKHWNPGDFGKFNRDLANYYASELKRCGLASLTGKSVLEIGFGNGSFAGWARHAGARYVGTEMIASLVDVGRQTGFDVHLDGRDRFEVASPEPFHCAVAFDVFEHLALDDLRVLLRRVRNCLYPDGVLVVRVPSGDSPFARAIQHGDLTHRLVLGSSAVRQLAEESGFEVVALREPVSPIGGSGAISGMRRLAVNTLRRILYPLIANILMGGGRPILSPNLLFVLRKADASAAQST